MAKARVFVLWALLSAILAYVPCAHADSLTPVSHPPLSERSLEFQNQAAVHSSGIPAEISYASERSAEGFAMPAVIGGYRPVSLERLRREQYRYPDQDLAGRMIETTTECPPLFESG